MLQPDSPSAPSQAAETASQAAEAATQAADVAVSRTQDALSQVVDKLYSWLDQAIVLLPNLVVALFVLLLFWIFSRLVQKVMRRLLHRFTNNPAIARLLTTISGIVVMTIGLFVALGVLQLDKTVTSLLAGAGVVGIALAFAFQDIASNLLAGIVMSFNKPFTVGDMVETQDVFGSVEQIDLRTTVIRTNDGQWVILTNKDVFENKLINFTRTGLRRVDLPVGVSYGEDLGVVRRVTQEAVSGVESRIQDREVEVFFTGFGGSSIDLVARFWIPYTRQVQYVDATSEAIMRIKVAYDSHGISIPFPIRTLDFGIKGGETMSEQVAPLLQRAGSG